MVQPSLETLVTPNKFKLRLLRETTSNKLDRLAQLSLRGRNKNRKIDGHRSIGRSFPPYELWLSRAPVLANGGLTTEDSAGKSYPIWGTQAGPNCPKIVEIAAE
jgi:hypothetical protein